MHAGSHTAGKLLCIKGPRNAGTMNINIEHESAMCLDTKKANGILSYIRHDIANSSRGDPSTLLSSGEAATAVQCPVLGPPVQQGIEDTVKSPK